MKERFIERESYKHLFAKNLLKKWFIEQDVSKDHCEVAQFKWRSNYGVFTELKFYETSEPYYFETSGGLLEYTGNGVNGTDLRGANKLNWFDSKFNRGKILFVPDVTIFHKGTPVILLEVVHTSPLTTWKIEKVKKFFEGYHVEVYEIEAEEVLRHDKSIVPKYLKCNQII
jgi:hypothetical protein